ncbi:TPA: M23 family metallopeptidase [Enterobacter sichuanensis]|jgi:Membrane proteins related to metalloendopeptidases|nr:M23 family metallopeptidase [Enterobacter sichuanensis]
MISLLLHLLLFQFAPDGVSTPTEHTVTRATQRLLSPSGLYDPTLLAMLGQIPRTPDLRAYPAWRSMYIGFEPLSCQISATTLWRKAFALLPSEIMPYKRGDFSCAPVMALARFFSVVAPYEAEDVAYEEDEAASNVFSVLNLTIPTRSASPPVWRPLLQQRTASLMDDIPKEAFIYPLTHDIVVTSPYGMRYHPIMHQFMRHEGVDFRAPVNSQVMAIADGDVVETGYGPVTGFYITVNHEDGWSSRYLHLNSVQVFKGDKVLRGNVIALSGATGRTNGPHLHLELSQHQQLLDPMNVLSASTLTPNVSVAQRKPAQEEAAKPKTGPVSTTPTIALISGEGENMQVGVRVGARTFFYSPGEPVETDAGIWRIVKRYGKYKLVKQEKKGDYN